jgi:hypothetical protein
VFMQGTAGCMEHAGLLCMSHSFMSTVQAAEIGSACQPFEFFSSF